MPKTDSFSQKKRNSSVSGSHKKPGYDSKIFTSLQESELRSIWAEMKLNNTSWKPCFSDFISRNPIIEGSFEILQNSIHAKNFLFKKYLENDIFVQLFINYNEDLFAMPGYIENFRDEFLDTQKCLPLINICTSFNITDDNCLKNGIADLVSDKFRPLESASCNSDQLIDHSQRDLLNGFNDEPSIAHKLLSRKSKGDCVANENSNKGLINSSTYKEKFVHFEGSHLYENTRGVKKVNTMCNNYYNFTQNTSEVKEYTQSITNKIRNNQKEKTLEESSSKKGKLTKNVVSSSYLRKLLHKQCEDQLNNSDHFIIGTFNDLGEKTYGTKYAALALKIFDRRHIESAYKDFSEIRKNFFPVSFIPYYFHSNEVN